MQGIFSTLLKGAKVLKSAGTVSDKFNSLGLNGYEPTHCAHYHDSPVSGLVLCHTSNLG